MFLVLTESARHLLAVLTSRQAGDHRAVIGGMGLAHLT